MMDRINQPLYMKDNYSGEVYQVLDVLKDDSETNYDSFSSNINIEETEEKVN
jgi:hypothetical protein